MTIFNYYDNNDNLNSSITQIHVSTRVTHAIVKEIPCDFILHI